MSISNDNMLGRLRAGDNQAFEIIYHTLHGRLHRFANEYLNDSDTADDVVQNAFTKLWQNRTALNEQTNLTAWLFTITRNETLSILEHKLVVDRHRHSEQLRLLDANYMALKEVKMSEDTYSDIIQILQLTLRKMSPKCRIVFECSRFRMMSNKEIAGYLSISVKTVETHMNRALKTLRIALADYI